MFLFKHEFSNNLFIATLNLSSRSLLQGKLAGQLRDQMMYVGHIFSSGGPLNITKKFMLLFQACDIQDVIETFSSKAKDKNEAKESST